MEYPGRKGRNPTDPPPAICPLTGGDRGDGPLAEGKGFLLRKPTGVRVRYYAGGVFDGFALASLRGMSEGRERIGARCRLRFFCSRSGLSWPGRGLPRNTRLASCTRVQAAAQDARLDGSVLGSWMVSVRIRSMTMACMRAVERLGLV